MSRKLKNEFKQTEQEQAANAEYEQGEAKPSKALLAARRVLGGVFIEESDIKKWVPFTIYVFVLCVILIFNYNSANRVAIEISETKRNIKELRFDYITTKTKLTRLTERSEVVKRAKELGLEEMVTPPLKIYINDGN
ncbi:MAG: FtsL-like putative cell division protein [Bacteroidales bacterium]|jgi:cell division protein FtsL